MNKRSAASLKKVTAENLAALGPERLAVILLNVAETRPELKRRLRMELAAEQGAEHLAAEIDKRLRSLETSRGIVSWRQRPAFVRDLRMLGGLIGERLAGLDAPEALDRLWRFLDAARRVSARVRGWDGIDDVFESAAGDVGRLLSGLDPSAHASALVGAILKDPSCWSVWLPLVLKEAPKTAAAALRLMQMREDAAALSGLIRILGHAAGDLEAIRGAYTQAALQTPALAADLARQYLRAGRTEDAGELLRSAAPKSSGGAGRLAAPDLEWEGAWIDYLEQSGRRADAQAVRWASFERTLSVERLRAFTARLADFDDVEAEERAFAIASSSADFRAGLRFLVTWPALSQAARMVETRAEEVASTAEEAQAWADVLRRRYPAAAQALLRRAAAVASRRRDFKTCDRLTAEADGIVI